MPGGVPGGTVGGTIGGTIGGVLGNPLPNAQPTNVTLPFGEGMTPPSLAGGSAQPQYTREAIEARVEGKVIARCTLTTAGTLTDCRIIKGLPFLDQAVLSTLAGQKYTPVMYQGHPQSVFYTLTFRFKLPLGPLRADPLDPSNPRAREAHAKPWIWISQSAVSGATWACSPV